MQTISKEVRKLSQKQPNEEDKQMEQRRTHSLTHTHMHALSHSHLQFSSKCNNTTPADSAKERSLSDQIRSDQLLLRVCVGALACLRCRF